MIKVGNVEGEVDCSIHHDGEPQDTDVLRSEVQGSRKIKPQFIMMESLKTPMF